MKLPSIVTLILFVVLQFRTAAQCPTCPGDYNGDLLVNNSDVITMLGSDFCSTDDDECLDLNEDGTHDLKDLMEIIQRRGAYGENCGAPLTVSTDAGVQLYVIEWAEIPAGEHEVFPDPIEPGTKVYRLYAELTDPDDVITGVYGTPEIPLHISTTTNFIIDVTETTISAPGLTIFYTIYPFFGYRTYLAYGWQEIEDDNNSNLLYHYSCDGGESPIQLFETGDNLSTGTSGMIWWGRDSYDPLPSEGNSLWLLGQFVTTGVFSGEINVAVANGRSGYIPTYHEGLSFSSENLSPMGCLDPLAINYTPDAIHEGPCYYPGDFDENGIIDTADLLALLESFGCNEMCNTTDMNGDGVVNTADLILLLILFNP